MAYLFPIRRAIALLAIASLAVAGCCASKSVSSGYKVDSASSFPRNTLEAQQLTAQAVLRMQVDPEGAETLLRQALAADSFHGPAHNNLGVLMLNSKQPRLYEAAHEFEWAGKLMPGHPDPRHNLAMTLEAAARYDDAISAYRVALETRPGYLSALQALTSLQLRFDKSDDGTTAALRTITMQGTTQQWRDWAAHQLRTAK